MASWEWLLPNPTHSSGLVGSRVAVLLTQPTGEPELLSALAVACRGAAGGLLAQAARTIRQAARSDDFNMAVFTSQVVVGFNASPPQGCTHVFSLWQGHGRR